DRPGLAPVEGLVEAQDVVVALRAHDPLGRSDQVLRVRGVDPDVRFGVVFDQFGVRCGIPGVASDLGGIRTTGPRVLAGRGAGARGFTAVPVGRSVAYQRLHL